METNRIDVLQDANAYAVVHTTHGILFRDKKGMYTLSPEKTGKNHKCKLLKVAISLKGMHTVIRKGKMVNGDCWCRGRGGMGWSEGDMLG